MSVTQANCPSCGAPIVFKIASSMVVVCEFCQSAVARTDRALENLGKVADLIETGSPLEVGLKGSYQGVSFELTGRAQMGHWAGGVWDEWYAAFSNGWWGWLAEAQGRFYLTFERPASEPRRKPPYSELDLGQPVAGLDQQTNYVVAEKGEARAIAAEGEIPWRLEPGARHLFADLSAEGGRFGTLDYSEWPPLLFLGHEVTLEQLGIDPEKRAERVKKVGAVTLSCPNCGGPLALRAPDRSERVTCPNCGSLLDVSQGKLSFFKALQRKNIQPVIPLGKVGNLGGVPYMVVGFVQRSVRVEGTDYFWEEYLLYNTKIGFRWLVRSDDHWNFVQPLAPGDVSHFGKTLQYRGKTFKLFQEAPARVEYVLGEFYWKVEVGETVRALDYVAAPEMISKEITEVTPAGEAATSASRPAIPEEIAGPAMAVMNALGVSAEAQQHLTGSRRPKPGQLTYGEINVSHGTYLKPQEVEQAFSLTGLPRPRNVAPNQPFPHKGFYKPGCLMFLLAFIFGIFMMIFVAATAGRTAYTRQFNFEPLANNEATQVVFTEQFRLEARRNVRVRATSPVNNSWIYAEGNLINEETGLVQGFSLPIEYYHGVDGGESWSEGGQTQDVYISALPAGTYTLRLEAQWDKWQQPNSMNVTIEQGVPRFWPFLVVLALIGAVPLYIGIREVIFEQKRWSESMFSSSG